jgi:hypothetical protein
MNTEDRLAQVFRGREVAGPASEAQIREIEEQLQVALPPSYRAFLARYGAAWLDAPYTIDGIRPDPEPGHTPLHGDVLAGNLTIRRHDSTGFFQKLVLITTDGSECFLYLDIAKAGPDGECPVIVIAPGVDGLVVAPSFLEFVEKAAKSDPLDGVV